MEESTTELSREQKASILAEGVNAVVRFIVDAPDAVRIQVVNGENTSVIELRVDKADVGKVIGKQGRNADAIRTVFQAACARLKIRAVLEIVDGHMSPRHFPRP